MLEGMMSRTLRLRAGLIAMALAVTMRPPAAEAQAQQTALPVVVIDTVSFTPSRIDPGDEVA